MQNKHLNFFLIVVISILAVNCANRGTPQGGEKDITPPVVTGSKPANYSTNFTGNKIEIYFDEYIKLKDLQKQLIISPPMKTQPEILPLGGASKRITIKIIDTLKPDMTYAFNFGQSVVDNNEENPFPFYRFVFSTGDYIDSLTVKGQIFDAEKLKPEEFVSVALYEKDTTYTDSIVYKEFPKYVTNTRDSTTVFTIENVKEGTYKLVALKDNNQNNKFEQATDKIAFQEGFITVPNDSAFYELTLFKEEQDFNIIRGFQVSGSKIGFGFTGNGNDIEVDLLSEKPEGFEHRLIKDAKADTLYYWHTPKFKSDSIIFNITNKTYNYKKDSLVVKLKDMEKDSLTIQLEPKGTIVFSEDVKVLVTTPLKKFDKSFVSLIDKDSLNVDYYVKMDSVKNKFIISFDKQEAESYNMQLLPGAITDLYGNTNDTINYNAKTKTYLDYGNLRVVLNNAKYPIIVQLTNDKGEVLVEKYSETTEPIDFNNINPQKYFLRVVYDTNGNKKWDSGNYLKQQQPERISYYPKEIEIRSGWDDIAEFNLLD